MWQYQNADNMYIGGFSNNNELYHYGIPGMKWGHRKNTSYNIEKQWYNDIKNAKKSRKDRDKKYAITSKQKYKSDIKKANSNYSTKMKKYKNSEEYKNREAKKKKIVKTGAKIAAGALAAYGAYKLSKVATKKIREIGYNKYKEAEQNDANRIYKEAMNRLNHEVNFAKGNKYYKNGYGEVAGKYGKYAYNVSNRGKTYGLEYASTKKAPTSTRELMKYAFKRKNSGRSRRRLTTSQLKRMGIKTFDFDRFIPD